MSPFEIEEARQRSIDGVRQKAAMWAAERGLRRKGMTTVEYMRALAAYRERLRTLARPGPKEWAHEILRRQADGDPRVLMQFVRLANAALGRHEEPALVSPAVKVPRPDAKDRQAGDVEVAL